MLTAQHQVLAPPMHARTKRGTEGSSNVATCRRAAQGVCSAHGASRRSPAIGLHKARTVHHHRPRAVSPGLGEVGVVLAVAAAGAGAGSVNQWHAGWFGVCGQTQESKEQHSYSATQHALTATAAVIAANAPPVL